MRKNICTHHGYGDCPACMGELIESDQVSISGATAQTVSVSYDAEFIPTGAEDGLTMMSDADPGL